MKTLAARIPTAQACLRVALFGALLAVVFLLTSPTAMAAKKKKEEPAPETKSYVMPYMIVLTIVGVGLMTVCRPGNRADKANDMHKKDEEE